MADDLSLQPLVISPEMAANARQAQEQAAQEQDANVEQLKAMFPDYDADVLSSILATVGGNMEAAVQQLLEMANGDTAAPPEVGGIDSDEELAMALFRQFADDLSSQLGVAVPEDVQN